MGRRPCCDRETVNRGAWTLGEDRILSDYISLHGHGNWRHLAQNAGLNRCGKSCRLRWMNYLRPDIKRGAFSPEEDDLIIRFHRLLGNRWALIARRIPGRTDNEIKNHWNKSLVKKSDPQISWPCLRNSVPVTIQKDQPNIHNSDETPKDSLQSYSSTSEDCNSHNSSKDTNTNPNFFVDLLLKTDNNIINDNNNVNAIIFGCNGKDNNLVDNEKDGYNIKCTDMSSLFGENNGEVMISSSCEVGPSDVRVQTRDTFLSELKKVASFLDLEDQEWEL